MLSRKPSRARVHGRSGVSARAAYRTQRARFQKMSWRGKLAALAFIAAAGAVCALSVNVNALVGAGIGAALGLALAAVLAAPNALIILCMLAVYAAFSYYPGGLYTALGSNFKASDPFGGSLALMMAAFLATWASVRFSRGRPWVTLALALGSTWTVGFVLGFLFPPLGLNAARLSIIAVLAVRCGGWDWVSGGFGLFLDKIRNMGKSAEAEPQPTIGKAKAKNAPQISAWLNRAEAEDKTAEILAALGTSYHVFHDVQVPKKAGSLAHLIIGPSGWYMATSVSTEGLIHETPREGLVVPDVEIGAVAATLMHQRRRLARALHIKEEELQALIVAHSTNPENVNVHKTLAVYEAGAGELPTGQVALLSPDKLIGFVDNGLEIRSSAITANVVRRARMRLTPAFNPVQAYPVAPALLATLDADGNQTGHVTPALDLSWMVSGARVDIATSAGTLTALRVAREPYRDNRGRMVVPLCVEEEWVAAEREGRAPTVIPYPVYAVSAVK